MKKLNEIVNFLLGKEKRAYALIGAMSEGASIEHPLSTHSASDGTSRKPAGNKAIIRCMAAMFVMLFTLGVGNAWGEVVNMDTLDWKKYATGTLTDGGEYRMYVEGSARYCYPTNKVLDGNGDPIKEGSKYVYYVDPVTVNVSHFLSNNSGSSGPAKVTADPTPVNGSQPGLFKLIKSSNTYKIQCKNPSDATKDYLGKTSVAWYASNNANVGTFTITKCSEGNEAPRFSICSQTSYYAIIGAIYSSGFVTGNVYKQSSGINNIPTTETTTSTSKTYDYTNVYQHWYFIPEAAFQSLSHSFYFTANAKVVKYAYGATPSISSAVVDATAARASWSDEAFTDMAGASVSGNTRKWATSITKDAYFKYSTPDGYVFRGWHDGNGNLIEGSGDNYNPTLTVANTTSSSSPEDKTVYAYFEAMPLFQATLLDASGNTVMDGDDPKQYSLADALTAAQANYTVVLQEDVALTDALNLNKQIKFDFNNHKLSSALDAAVNVTSTVTFLDNSLAGTGGVSTTGATAVTVGNGGNLTIKDGFYNAAATAVAQAGAGIVTIQNGGFKGGSQDVSGTITFNGGYYVHNGGLNVTGSYAISGNIPAGLKFSSATYHYTVADTDSPNYIACLVTWEEIVGVETIGRSQNFNSLKAALAFVNNVDSAMTILLKEDCELPVGTYTLPSKASLLIPYGVNQTTVIEGIDVENTSNLATTAYRTLTMANGAHLDAFGRIEVGGRQTTGPAYAGGAEGVSRPVGTYGLIVMKPGSSITMNSGSELRAWGYILGDGSKDDTGKYLSGEIDVRRGAVVREQFQVMDWKGLNCAVAMNSGTDVHHKVLPVSQYYIQNIEVPATYHPGSNLWGCVSVMYEPMTATMTVKDGGVIGVWRSAKDKDLAMFLMKDEDYSEDTWVRKWYDRQNDKQVYEVNNSAFLGSLRLQMHILTFDCDVDSREYVLPIPSNFKMHLLTGELSVTQDTELQPGSEMIANKKSTIYIAENVALALNDASEWGDYVIKTYDHTNHDGTWAEGTTISWIPAIGNEPAGKPNKRPETAAGLGDAKLTVHGTVDVRGSIVTPASGASITSTIEDAGTIIFTAAVPETANIKGYSGRPDLGNNLYHVNGFANTSERPAYVPTNIIPALLKNDEGSQYGAFSQTANTPAHHSYCFVDMDGDGKGEWISLTADVDPDIDCIPFVYDNYGVFYIKPQAYVPISIGRPTEEADHTYRDHYAGTGKIYIQLPDCQWWEVKAVPELPGVYHCTHEKNNTYYYYNGNEWTEKRFNVTWKNWDGSTLDEPYQLTYKTTPKYLGSTPQRAASAYYTYDFDGWTPEITQVTKDTTYTAKYIQTDRKYLITFKRPGDVLIEQQYVKVGDVPECKSYTLTTNQEWNPALCAVTGDATYTLNDKNINGPFTINYYNWNGGEPLKTENLAKNASLTPPSNPTKAALKDEQYSFAGWMGANGTVYASNALPAATENASYTAKFSASARKYTIKFVKENGNPETPADVLSTQSLDYGVTPTPPTGEGTTKASTAQYTYTLVWSPLVGSVTGNQNYFVTFAQQTRQYTVTWKNYDGTTLAVDYVNYNAAAEYSGLTPTKPSDATYAYTFTGWNTTPAEHVTADVVYTAQFSSAQKTLEVAGPENLDEDKTLETVHVQVTGVLNVGTNKTLEAEYLILESNGTTTGQIIPGAGASLIAANAYFDLSINAESHKWYGVAVPWPVNATNGVSVNGKTLVLGKDFDIIYYDGARRAVEGKQKCWKYVENDGDKTLQPGRLYMIGLVQDAATIRFAKKAYAALLTTTTSVSEYSSSVATDANWNGVANPALFHAFVNAGADDAIYGPNIGQVYNPETNSYNTVDMSSAKFVVGQGAFVQATEGKSIVVSCGGAYAAPRRAKAEKAPLYDVRIAAAEAEYTDRLFVRVEDEKEADKYVIGKDLAKLGVSKSVAQMWINRYNTELCLNTMTMENGVAEYPLGIYAPKAGEYTITIHNAQFTIQNEVYLTLNGEAIWNLSDAAYTGTFDAGTTNAYGLRISAKSPQIATGIDEAVVDAKGETRKVLIDNKVYIIRGEKVYTIDGQLVK